MDNTILNPETLLTTATVLSAIPVTARYIPSGFLKAFERKRVPDTSEKTLGSPLTFRKVTPADMPLIWKYLQLEPGKTTDFSYGGLLMWVDYFNYEFAIAEDTLFIKGLVENHRNLPAFSLPVGKLPLSRSVELLKDYCRAENIPLIFSAVPEYAFESMLALNPSRYEEITDWGDYLYSAEKLSTLSGKKMAKKRNHVNQFLNSYREWRLDPITTDNYTVALGIMDKYDLQGDDTEMAKRERDLSRYMIECIANGDEVLKGAILYAGEQPCAFTIGDIKGDTLFIHVEKALTEYSGSFEMINKQFAAQMVSEHPEIEYINREDDAGDEGLRYAKQSYHPIEILKKYNIEFAV